ncbi:MAG TPA: hypothetical protein VJV78_43055, partial [Polyangiales bacterium]|nr:hypothetical protein [Polyangiales bacterium]
GGTTPPQGGAGIVGGVTGGGISPAGRGGGGEATNGPPPAGMGGTVPPATDGGLPPFDAGSEPNRNQIQASAVCDRLVSIQCAAEQHCCTAPGRTYDTCKRDMLTDCTNNAHLSEIAMNQVSGFSATAATAAFTKLEQLSAACDPSVSTWSIAPDGLRGILQGTVAPMGSCKPSGFPSVPGYGAALASCTQITTHACLFTGDGPTAAPVTATCAARTGAGTTCFVDTNCMDGLYCANTQMKYSSGKCAAGKADGMSCGTGAECASQTCKSGSCTVATSQTAYCLKP